MGKGVSIEALVARFREQIASYKGGVYNETQLRREFLDPFFKALGWDVDNVQGYAEPYKDVIHEDAIKIGGATKAPDYAFRVGGARKFFVEAKKPSVYIKEELPPAYQLRRYAWSAKLPLSILTDFEEFAVYDCRTKPLPTDKAGKSRILYLTFDQYLDKWDDIQAVFAREAVLKGAFDKYALSTKPRGTMEVDDEFLKDMEQWRASLAANISFSNPALGVRELNHAVQMTLDRIVFLRICEDRAIEQYGALQALLNGTNVYKRLVELFRKADDRYNSGLFHFDAERGRPEAPDTLTPGLAIGDKQLKEIIRRLYYPESPYEFSVLSADILGQVYERFLGKVIVPKGRGAEIIEKPEVKKAGGVYYTPTFIVEYIVKNTVGRLVEGKTPKDVEKLRVLDPACGSGSFLLGAYEFLLKWHRDWYANNKPEEHARGKSPKIYQAGVNDWRLTTAEKKRILLSNIHGVDIDSQAVEVTKLSLLLKVLEGESSQSIESQFRMFHARALPDLQSNIKCGNSLIGPDFYEGRDAALFGEDEQYRINVFDWKKEFPAIMKSGGFDAVIGNPPYVRIQSLMEFHPEIVPYLKQYRSASEGNFDIYIVFIEKSLELINKKGLTGHILPHKFFQGDLGVNIRKIIAEGKSINRIVNFGSNQMFKDATTYTCLLFMSKAENASFEYFKYALNDEIKGTLDSIKFINIPVSELDIDTWNFHDTGVAQLLAKLSAMPIKLEDITRKIFVGLQTSADKIYVLKKTAKKAKNTDILHLYSASLDSEIEIESGLVKPFLMGKDVKRYETPEPNCYVIFPYAVKNGKAVLMPSDHIKRNFPLGWDYLLRNKLALENREKGKFKATWWQFGRTQNLTEFETVKIMTPEIAQGCQMTLDTEGKLYHTTVVYGFVFRSNVTEKNQYYLGLLNSKLLWFFLKKTGYVLRGEYFRFKTQYLNPFPIRPIDFSDKADKARHARMVSLVEAMLDLNKKLSLAGTPHEKELLSRRIEHTDSQIDALVYDLYALTPEEIEIVEGKG